MINHSFIILLSLFITSISYAQSIDYKKLKLELQENNEWNQSQHVAGESSWIEEWTAYLNNDTYYMFIETQNGKKYIYCNIPENDIKSFIENNLNSWGKSYHRYIKKHTCY